MKRASGILSGLLIVAVLVMSAVPAMASHADFTIEVAEDGTRFVFDEGPVLPNGYPAYGNGFVTQGYIYPAGTLTDSNGVNPDGTPEFPDKVIGEWTCFGYFVGEGADTTEGAWVVTTQVFDFSTRVPGSKSITTIGFETPAGAGPAVRTIVGGSGDHFGASGEVMQVTLGHNASDGVNATFVFDFVSLSPRSPDSTVIPGIRII